MATFETQLKAGHFHVAPADLQTFTTNQLINIRTEAFQTGFLLIALAALAIILPTLLLTNKMHH
ncbi:hypothetical protein D1831_07135 [Lactiplantibacillus garii]|uniref:Uncharacterized protein n=1 Tax=Lactiplantibacillus garii TaxID=2306423 RepID=A0A3R8KES5_9LACO|nr:hypothetical protein D1831_07135 [Lactiplantibacillus garii]